MRKKSYEFWISFALLDISKMTMLCDGQVVSEIILVGVAKICSSCLQFSLEFTEESNSLISEFAVDDKIPTLLQLT